MKQSDNLTIVDLGKDAEGIAHKDSKTFFVPFTLPNEIVDAEILKEKNNTVFAKVHKINKQSVNRVKPVCPYFEMCGGCDLQHLSYEKQLEFKTKLVKNTILKIANIACDVENCKASDNQFDYRNKIALPVSFEKGKNKIGMFQSKSHSIIEIEKCFLCEYSEKLIKVLNDYLLRFPNENITFFVARKIEETLLLTIVSKIKQLEGLNSLNSELLRNFNKVGININVNNKQFEEILTNNFVYVGGEKEIEVCENHIKFSISSGSFFQVNNSIRNKIYSFVLNQVRGGTCLDAYCGAGLLTAQLSKKCNKVIGVEISKFAIDCAQNLIKQNNINNASFVCGDCIIEVSKILENSKIDYLILDPPRSGCDNALLNNILKHNIKKIIYISCSPQTLARDLKILKEKYEIENITPFDMFPQTKHIETVVVLKIK